MSKYTDISLSSINYSFYGCLFDRIGIIGGNIELATFKKIKNGLFHKQVLLERFNVMVIKNYKRLYRILIKEDANFRNRYN